MATMNIDTNQLGLDRQFKISVVEARKKVLSDKPKKNYLVVTMDYVSFVLPYEDGLLLAKALENAEQLDRQYKPTRIESVNSDKIGIKPLSNEEYVLLKMAGILGIDPDDLRKKE